MYIIAIKMLMGDKAKYFGLVFGIMFATLLMSQQVSIFLGILNRTSNQITDISESDIWVTAPEVKYFDEMSPIPTFGLYKVRGVGGVEWAVPLFKEMATIKTEGKLQQVFLIGVDDYSLVGKPPKMLHGNWQDLKKNNAIIMDKAGWEYIWPDKPVKLGTEIELNENRAQIAGICEASPPFMTFPVVFTRFSNVSQYVPLGRKQTTFIIVKAKKNIHLKELCRKIEKETGLQALTTEEFRSRSITHYLKKTGIPINFGITVALGFLIGTIITAQTLYIFIIENIKQFGVLKAIGITNKQILFMVLVQTAMVGIIGFSLGVGLAALFFESTSNLNAMRGFFLNPYVVLGTAITITTILLLSAFISIRKVLSVDPATVFRG
ncbi:MAG: FtsX-like permease family protein [Rickettsiales bacterium]|nr:FtsX-like permease family protein [Rickettsiales bacterium]